MLSGPEPPGDHAAGAGGDPVEPLGPLDRAAVGPVGPGHQHDFAALWLRLVGGAEHPYPLAAAGASGELVQTTCEQGVGAGGKRRGEGVEHCLGEREGDEGCDAVRAGEREPGGIAGGERCRTNGQGGAEAEEGDGPAARCVHA
jgi:hypothetical protein